MQVKTYNHNHLIIFKEIKVFRQVKKEINKKLQFWKHIKREQKGEWQIKNSITRWVIFY